MVTVLRRTASSENILFIYLLFIFVFVRLIACSKMPISHSFGEKNKQEDRKISLFAV